MIMKIILKTNTTLLNSKIESALENFKLMESQVLFNIDIEKCIKDYLDVIFIYDGRLLVATPV